ncbi:MAG: hypothetical protein Kow0090_14950 [Myxococcota bacterium]
MLLTRRNLARIAPLALMLFVAACAPSPVEEAEKLIEQGEYLKAEKRLRIYLSEKKEDPKAAIILAQIEFWKKNPQRATKILEAALEKEPNLKNEAAKKLRAVAGYHFDQSNDALAFLLAKKASELDAQLSDEIALDLLSRGKAIAKIGTQFDLDRALPFFVAAGNTSEKRKRRAAVACGDALSTITDRAFFFLVPTYLEKCLLPFDGENKRFSQLFKRLGVALFRGGENKWARDILSRAVTLDPALGLDSSVVYILDLGTDPKASSEKYQEYIDKFPDSPFTPFAISAKAEILIEEGNRDRGIDLLEQVIKDFPDFENYKKIQSKLEKLKRYIIVEEFNRPELNSNLWTEVLTSNIPGADHFKVHKIQDGKYFLIQPEPRDMGTGLMSNMTFKPGNTLTYEFNIVEASGTWSVGINVNQPGGTSLVFLAGNWGGRPVGAGDDMGAYSVTLEFKDRYSLATVTGPRHNKHRRAIHNKIPPYFFTIGARTGHNGVMKISFDNIMVGKSETQSK